MLPTYQELPRRTNSFDGYCLSQPTALNIMLEILENHYALPVNLKINLKIFMTILEVLQKELQNPIY